MKPKEQTKPIEEKSNNQPKNTTVFNDLINKRKKKITTKDVSFYKYKDSKELFNPIKNNQIKFSKVKNKQNEFLNKLSNIKNWLKN